MELRNRKQSQSELLLMPQDIEYLREMSPQEQERLEESQRSFLDAQDNIKSIMEQVAPRIEEERCEDVVRQLILKTFGQIFDSMLVSLRYQEAMALLSKATQELSDSQRQPQDLKIDIDFYGQVQRLVQNFVTDVRRSETLKIQNQENIVEQRNETNLRSQGMISELERMQAELKQKYGEEEPNSEDVMVKRLKAQQRMLDDEYDRLLQLEEDVKADAIHAIETKNTVLGSIGQFFDKQKSVLCVTKLTFNFDKGVKDVRSSLFHFGATKFQPSIAKQSQWPYLEALKNPKLELFEQEQLLSQLRITKIEWAVVDVICTLKFHFNNGTHSPQLGGKVAPKEIHELREGQEISKIYVCVRDNLEYMEAMVLVDQNNEMIVRFSGDTVTGNWASLELKRGEHLIGIKANMCNRFVRGLGFFLWKPGMGLPNYDNGKGEVVEAPQDVAAGNNSEEEKQPQQE